MSEGGSDSGGGWKARAREEVEVVKEELAALLSPDFFFFSFL